MGHYSICADLSVVPENNSPEHLCSGADVGVVPNSGHFSAAFTDTGSRMQAAVSADSGIGIHDNSSPVDNAQPRTKDVGRDREAEADTMFAQTPLHECSNGSPECAVPAIADILGQTQVTLKMKCWQAKAINESPSLQAERLKVGAHIAAVFHSGLNRHLK